MEIPFYYSFKDFEQYFEDDFLKLSRTYQSLDKSVFSDLFKERFNEENVIKIKKDLIFVCDVLTKRIHNNLEFYREYVNFIDFDIDNLQKLDIYNFTDENNDSLFKPDEDEINDFEKYHYAIDENFILNEHLEKIHQFIEVVKNPDFGLSWSVVRNNLDFKNVKFLVQPNKEKFNDFILTIKRINKFFENKENLTTEIKDFATEKINIETPDNILKIANVVFSAETKNLELLKYFVENFSGYRKDFTELTKFNQIYFYFNYLQKVPKQPYQKLIMEMFGFDYENSEIKGENLTHQTTLKNLHVNFNKQI